MIPPEVLWQPEMLARVLPKHYGHLMPKDSFRATGSRSYTIKPVEGGCAVISPQFGSGGVIPLREHSPSP